MEARIARLEASMAHVERDVGDMRAEMRSMRADMRSDFRTTFGALIVVALGLATIMAKGFNWL